MGRVKACRVCLNTDVKMERIQGTLENNIKSVFGNNVMSSSDLPDYCCYECTALLTKFSKFRKKYFMAQSLLFNILQNHGVVTENEIKSIDRNASKLTSDFSTKHVENYIQPQVKMESDPMEGTLEMTVDEDNNNSSSEDDEPLNSIKDFEDVNEKTRNRKHYISTRKNKNVISVNDLGEPSNKVKRLTGNYVGKEKLLQDIGVNKQTGRAGTNSVIYLQDFENEDGAAANTIYLDVDFQNELSDIDNAFQEHDPSSALSIQILENQNMMITNQHTIMSQLAEFSAQLKGIDVPNVFATTDRRHHTVPTKSFDCPVIENKKQLEEFENNLNDPEKRDFLKKKYEIFFKGLRHGVNAAYILIDALFSRKFLTTVSWAGGSRKEESKIPFKIYNNTINFIYELIHECDNNFSLLNCHSFIKIILRNSVQRYHSKGLRMSTMKCRRRRRLDKVSESARISNDLKSDKLDVLEET